MALPHTKTSGSARMAVVYITIGAIMDVWTVVWYTWMIRHPPQSDTPYFWCYGLMLTGLTLIIIGLALGPIGRFARPAEAPPDTSNSQGAAQLQGATPLSAAPGAMPSQAPIPIASVPGNFVTPAATAQAMPVAPGGPARR